MWAKTWWANSWWGGGWWGPIAGEIIIVENITWIGITNLVITWTGRTHKTLSVGGLTNIDITW